MSNELTFLVGDGNPSSKVVASLGVGLGRVIRAPFSCVLEMNQRMFSAGSCACVDTWMTTRSRNKSVTSPRAAAPTCLESLRTSDSQMGEQHFNNVTYNHLDNGGVSELRITPIRPNQNGTEKLTYGSSINDFANHHQDGGGGGAGAARMPVPFSDGPRLS